MTEIETEKRIREEYEELSKNPITNIGLTVQLVDKNNIFKWKATLSGEKDISYNGGLFTLLVNFSDDYPNHPPEVCFITPIYHVNINPNKSNEPGAKSLGHVCIPILNNWKPEYKMKEVFNDIFALFYKANPDYPYDINIANEFRYNRDLYEEKIKYFTKKYANPNLSDIDKEYNTSWDFSYKKTEKINPTKIEAGKRIRKEYEEVYNKIVVHNIGLRVQLFDKNNIFKWKLTLTAPKETSYNGGIFIVSINFPDDYPKNHPEIYFITPIYHVNVYPKKSYELGAESLGYIYSRILNWRKPGYNIEKAILDIYILFYNVDPNAPYDYNMATEFRYNRLLYERKIKYFTKKYANPNYCNIEKEYNTSWDFSYKKTDLAEKRIMKEYEELSENLNANIGLTVKPFDKFNNFKWDATLTAPKETSYNGGKFILSVNFPSDYPNHPPEICFLTPIYHLNVNPIQSNEPGAKSLGHICIPILKRWKPEYKMREVFNDIFGLFYKADPDNPCGLDRANEFRNNITLYEEKIKYFTRKYAHPQFCDIYKEYYNSWDFSYN